MSNISGTPRGERGAPTGQRRPSDPNNRVVRAPAPDREALVFAGVIGLATLVALVALLVASG